MSSHFKTEAGEVITGTDADNLTQPECPCLLHVGTQTTDQMLLVRMEPPKNGK